MPREKMINVFLKHDELSLGFLVTWMENYRIHLNIIPWAFIWRSKKKLPSKRRNRAKRKGLWIAISVIVVVVVILLALVLSGFFGPGVDEVLKIGTILPLTGGLAAYGPIWKKPLDSQ